MKQLKLIDEFREELNSLSKQIESSSAMGHTDINKICENLVCELFRELFGFKQLRNLNDHEKKNFPAIDLADDSERIGIQVSSTTGLDKIKESLEKFLKYELNKKYDRLIVFVLKKKQERYSQPSVDKISQASGFKFSVDRDVLDFSDVASKAANATPQSLNKAVKLLNAYNRGCGEGLADEDFDPSSDTFEKITANLVELFFPQTLYIADLIPNILTSSKSKKRQNQRSRLRDFLDKNAISLPSDYEINAGKLITFHNLEERHNPYHGLIDEGTVTPLNPKDFYSIDVNHERMFKSLLRLVLQQKLYKHRVLWQHEEKMFIFLPLKDHDKERKENWTGKKRANRRTVYERKYQNKDPNKVLSTKHFAFLVDFLILDNQWYLSITPDWFFSYGNDYKKSRFAEDLLSGLKRLEKNRSIFDQFRFIHYWLSELDTEDIFTQKEKAVPTLSFGRGVDFSNALQLDEEQWEPLPSDDGDEQAHITANLFDL